MNRHNGCKGTFLRTYAIDDLLRKSGDACRSSPLEVDLIREGID